MTQFLFRPAMPPQGHQQLIAHDRNFAVPNCSWHGPAVAGDSPWRLDLAGGYDKGMQFSLARLLIVATVGPPTAVAVWLSAPYVMSFIGSLLMRLGGCC